MVGRSVFGILGVVLTVVFHVNGFYVNETSDADVVIASYGTGAELEKYSPSLFYMNNYCEKMLNLVSRNAIRVSPYSTNYPPATYSCKMGVKNQRYPSYLLGVTFKTIRMASKSAGTCRYSRLDLYTGLGISGNRISEASGICGTRADHEDYSTRGDFLTMLYTTNNLRHYSQNFLAVITPYHYGHCADDEFRCANKRCVTNVHLCDGYDNCGDDSDEKSCKKLLLSIAAIIGIAIGGAILVAIVITIVCCCCCCASCGYERF